MRFGGPVFGEFGSPDEWARAVRAQGYRAAYCPVDVDAADGDDAVEAYARAAEAADIVIAEVGAWSNPLAADEGARQAAVEKCKRALALADRIGARCCVNIAGSRGEQWDGPHPDNLTDDTFDKIVETVRAILDDVQPTRTYYTLEPMPWIFPDSPESYLGLIHAIDRKRFGVHLDPVNMISSPQRYFGSAHFLRECFRLLGPHVRSCHAKDILLTGRLTVHLDEVRPGLGGLDYAVFLQEMARLEPDTPLLLEHLKTPEEYALAAEYVRGVARQTGIAI